MCSAAQAVQLAIILWETEKWHSIDPRPKQVRLDALLLKIATRLRDIRSLVERDDTAAPPTDTAEGIERFGRLAELLLLAGFTSDEVRADFDRWVAHARQAEAGTGSDLPSSRTRGGEQDGHDAALMTSLSENKVKKMNKTKQNKRGPGTLVYEHEVRGYTPAQTPAARSVRGLRESLLQLLGYAGPSVVHRLTGRHISGMSDAECKRHLALCPAGATKYQYLFSSATRMKVELRSLAGRSHGR